MANGLTCPGPLSRIVSAPSMTCSMPPPPVLMTTATRSRCSGVQPSKSKARSFDRLRGRRDAEVDEPAHAAGHLAVHVDERIEALHLGRDLHVVRGRVERRDRAAAGRAGVQVRQERLRVVADRRDRAHAGHDRPASRVRAGHRADCSERPGSPRADRARPHSEAALRTGDCKGIDPPGRMPP